MTFGLLVVGHGSKDGGSQRVTTGVAAAATFALGSIPTVAAFLDHDQMTPAAGLDALAERGTTHAVVVPLLLGAAFHVAELPGLLTGGLSHTITEHLGPEPLVIDALISRIGADLPSSLLLCAAGSTDEGSQEETRIAASLLDQRLGVPCTAAFLSSAAPDVESAIEGAPLLVPYLLSEGVFSAKLSEIAKQRGLVASPVIGAHPKIVELVVRRFSDKAPG